MSATIAEILRCNFDLDISTRDMRGWSRARRELFFLGVALCRGAVNNARTRWNDEEIERLAAELAGETLDEFETEPIP